MNNNSNNSVEKILKAFECHNVRSMSGCKCEQCPYINEKSCIEAFYYDTYRFLIKSCTTEGFK